MTYVDDALRSERLMRDAAERLDKAIKTDRGMKSTREITEYLAEQQMKADAYEFMGALGTAQPEGAIEAIREALEKALTPEQIKTEIISNHIRRIMAADNGEREEYLGLFGRCVGLCWLINNEDNYERA